MKAKYALGSALWSSATALSRYASARGWLASERLDAGRVISIGNIQSGGAGKTPLVAQLAREALDRSLRVCILSRGYMSDWEIHGGVIEPDSEPVNPDLSGDEPALLQDLVPGAWIAVGSDRGAQYRKAKQRLGAPFDLVILDDGFQHWKIQRDIDVLALTSAGPRETYFRDRTDMTRKADLLVWTKGKKRPETYGKPLVETRYRLARPAGEPVWLICGVADPASVLLCAREAGYDIRRGITLEDHTVYERSLIDRWLGDAQSDHCKVAITGKDWVKWRALGIASSRLIVLEPELSFEKGREHWDRVIWGTKC